jgi:competence protein ComEC
MLTALLAAAPALAFREFRSRRFHLKALSLLWFSAGLAFGAGFCLDEAAIGDASAALVEKGNLAVRAVEGMPAADSVPTRSGGLSFPFLVSAIEYSGKHVRGRIDFASARIPLRAILDGGSGIETGASLRIAGAPVAGRSGSGTVLFAKRGEVSSIGDLDFPSRIRSGLRNACALALAATGGRSAGFLQALLLGIKDDLDSRESDAFKNAGCSHILALSGQHLAILSSLVLICLTRMLGRRRAGRASIAFAILFVWIAGPSPSLLRSLLMVLVAALGRAIDRPQDGLSTLALCFILALPLDPSAARSLSFVLSYLAIFGLVTLSAPFEYLFGKRLPPFLAAALSAGCAAQVATAPVLAASFGVLVPAGLVASLLAGPLVLALTWLALGAALVGAAIPLAIPVLGFIVDIPYRLLMAVMETAALCPSVVLSGSLESIAACLVVVLAGAFVYARPHADSRIRFSARPEAIPRGRGSGHVQEIRSELPGQSPPA